MDYLRQPTRCVAYLAVIVAMAAALAQAEDRKSKSAEKEAALIQVLKSDAPGGDKAIACKELAVYGSEKAVPHLAPLLADGQLASWARIALEAIPGSAADEALRKATTTLEGELLVGAINSIGVRRDADAVEPVSGRLRDKDTDVASAAAAALGRIGNEAAADVLRKSLAGAPPKVRSTVAEGCVLCAERFLAEGNAAEAIAIYDQVRQADVPQQRILEATRGAILARKLDGIPLLVEQLRSPNKVFFQIALTTAREVPGEEVAQALAAEIVGAAPDRAALMLVALVDRNDTSVLPAVLQAAESGPKQVRIAATAALGSLGDVSSLSALVELAIDSDEDLAQAAKAALARLAGEKVDAEIVARLADAEGKKRPLLIELVGLRRIEATQPLLGALGHPDAAVRGAALTALGLTVGPKNLSVLIAQVVSPKVPEDAPVAQQALRAACVRMPQREECAEQLASALDRSPAMTKGALLEILGAVGGAKALATVGAAAKGDDPQLQDIGSRLLGEWMTADAAPVLLDLTKTAPGDKYQVRALRGYIRIARQFTLPEKERAEMCQKALEASRNVAEQKLVLDVLKRYPNADMLALAVKAAQTPELKGDAMQVALAIVQKMGGKGADAQELLSKIGLDPVKLEIVKAEYGAGASQKDVTEALRKQAGELPLIALPSPSYNAAFGGDPAEGTPKQLKVQYRINGKDGEATFAEDSVILLPIPE